jgi:hypothetical protein
VVFRYDGNIDKEDLFRPLLAARRLKGSLKSEILPLLASTSDQVVSISVRFAMGELYSFHHQKTDGVGIEDYAKLTSIARSILPARKFHCADVVTSLAPPDVPWHNLFSVSASVSWFETAVKRHQMKNPTPASEVSAKLGFPSSETMQGLRLWKAFLKLPPSQRSEVLALIEQLATDPAPLPGGISGQFRTP